MTIPESVQLLGVIVPVLPFEQKTRAQKETLGEACFSTKEIYIAERCHGNLVPQNVREHTFFHELLHQVLNSAGYNRQNDDEQFVDVVSGLLHQALGPHMR